MIKRRNKTKYLDPEVISGLDKLSLIAKLVVEGFIVGLHKSPYHGFSVEFAEHRPYMPGDDINNIDWKVYGRTDRYYIKEYEEETNLRCHLLLDTSGSMGYSSSGNISKLEYARYLVASIGYLMVKQQDALALTTFDNQIKTSFPPRGKKSHLNWILNNIENLKAKNRTDIPKFIHKKAESISNRSLIILISDLLDKPDKIIKSLKHLRHYNHEVIVFQVLDNQEKKFTFDNQTKFKDLENNEIIETVPWHLKEEYKDLVNSHINEIKSKCLNNNISFVSLTTNDNLKKALIEYIKKRKKIF